MASGSDGKTGNNSSEFCIRLQFPNGLSELVHVQPNTTVADLYNNHVALQVTEGLVGQLIYMGRPLNIPSATMSSLSIAPDTVIQIFMRRPVQQPSPEAVPSELDPNAPGMAHGLTVVCGFGLLCSWMYLLFGGGEDEDGDVEWEMNLPALVCLTILTVIFILAGGLTRFF